MRRFTVIGCTLLLATLPATAFGGMGEAQEREYGGRIASDPGTYFGFNVTGRRDNRKLTRFLVDQIPFACTDEFEPFRTGGPINGRIAVKRSGRIRGSLTDLQKGGRVTLKLRGKLDGRRARGTLNITSRPDSDPGTHCYSGTLAWKAKKPSVPLPGPPPGP